MWTRQFSLPPISASLSFHHSLSCSAARTLACVITQMANHTRQIKLKNRHQNPNKTTNTGVRTRAKTLALRNTLHDDSSSAYLQLRSRRLYRPIPPAADEACRNRILRPSSEFGGELMMCKTSGESTPRSPLSNSQIPKTLCSVRKSSKQTFASFTPKIPFPFTNPTTQEIEAFFSATEFQQLKFFMDKYNFDPVNEKPLPGRFEWEQVRL